MPMRSKITQLKSPQARKPVHGRALEIDEVRLVADLRIMHAKVDELYHVVSNLKRRHRMDAIEKYADRRILDKNIEHVDEIYLWFVELKNSLAKSIAAAERSSLARTRSPYL